MDGMIVGGMEFVWAAYGISAVVLALYIGSVWSRYRAGLRREMTRSGASQNG